MKLFNLAILLILFFAKAEGQFDYPPCIAYDTVGKDTIRVLNSYSNSLYAGIDNIVEIDKKNVPFKNLIVECAMGMVMEDETNYLVIPAKPGTTLISIYQYDQGDTVLYFSKIMNVRRFPSPYVTLDGIKITDYDFITKKLLKKSNYFEVHLSDDFVKDGDWYKVKSFVFGYPVGSLYMSKSFEGAVISDELIKTIKSLNPGSEASFIFTISGSGDIYKRLPPVKVKIY
jgi:hypothetical protein